MHAENQQKFAKLDQKLDRIEQKLDDFKKESDRHSLILDGPDGRPEEGLLIQHRLTERAIKKVSKLFWAVLLGIATTAGTFLVSMIRGGSGHGPTTPHGP